MKGRFLPGFLGILLVLAGCSGGSETGSQANSQASKTAGSPAFASPLVAQSRHSPSSRPVAGLLQPTNAKARATAIVAGRQDPFAVIPQSMPIVVTATRSKTSVKVAPLPTALSKPTKSAPIVRPLPTIPLPPLAAIPSAALPNLSTAPLPPVKIPVAPAPPPSPTSLAEAVEVSGVVKVAGKWNVIVKEPSAASSRYVAVGEYVENGKVLVKTVLSPASADPIVVLQQSGVEIRKPLV